MAPPAEVLLDSSHVKTHRCAAGGKGTLARKRSESAETGTSKIHALTDGQGRPLAFLLTGGQAMDCRAAETLLRGLAPSTLVMADWATTPTPCANRPGPGCCAQHPTQAQPAVKTCFSPALYRGCNAIERMFCRLKDV